MAKTLREYRMRFEAVKEGEAAIDPNASGLQSKLGGVPDWMQDEDWSACPECRERISFVAQIDSFTNRVGSRGV